MERRQLRSTAQAAVLGHIGAGAFARSRASHAGRRRLVLELDCRAGSGYGQLVWYYQHLPRDNWDLDHVFERYVVDVDVAPDAAEVRWINPVLKRSAPGKRRVVSGIPGKTSIVFTLDAKTGQFLWARRRSTRT